MVQAHASDADTDAGRPASVREDVVVGETRVVSEPDRDWTWQRDDAPGARVLDTRSAIIKARESYRGRVKATANRPTTRAEESGSIAAEGAMTSAEAAPQEAPPTAHFTGDSEARPVRGASESGAGRVSHAADADAGEPAWLEAVPVAKYGVDLRPTLDAVPDHGRVQASGSASEGSTSGDGFELVDCPQPRAVLPPVAGDERRSEVGPAADAEGSGRQRHSFWRRPAERLASPEKRPPEGATAHVSHQGEFVIPDGVSQATDLAARDDDAVDEINGRQAAYRLDAPSVMAESVKDRYGQEDPRGDEPGSAPEGWSLEWVAEAIEQRGRAGETAISAMPMPSERHSTDAIDLGIKVAPGLPRVCRTCRDFRPAEGGGRGWCANEWAFTHRRMVDGEDAMPCETSLGSWWLPADDVWQERADVSSHGQPTPLLDAVVAHRGVEPLRRRGS